MAQVLNLSAPQTAPELKTRICKMQDVPAAMSPWRPWPEDAPGRGVPKPT